MLWVFSLILAATSIVNACKTECLRACVDSIGGSGCLQLCMCKDEDVIKVEFEQGQEYWLKKALSSDSIVDVEPGCDVACSQTCLRFASGYGLISCQEYCGCHDLIVRIRWGRGKSDDDAEYQIVFDPLDATKTAPEASPVVPTQAPVGSDASTTQGALSTEVRPAASEPAEPLSPEEQAQDQTFVEAPEASPQETGPVLAEPQVPYELAETPAPKTTVEQQTSSVIPDETPASEVPIASQSTSVPQEPTALPDATAESEASASLEEPTQTLEPVSPPTDFSVPPAATQEPSASSIPVEAQADSTSSVTDIPPFSQEPVSATPVDVPESTSAEAPLEPTPSPDSSLPETQPTSAFGFIPRMNLGICEQQCLSLCNEETEHNSCFTRCSNNFCIVQPPPQSPWYLLLLSLILFGAASAIYWALKNLRKRPRRDYEAELSEYYRLSD